MFIKKFLGSFLPLVFIAAILLGYYFYTPKSVKLINERINASDSEVLNDERLQTSEDLAVFLVKGLPKDSGKVPTLVHLFLGYQRRFVDLRINKAIEEIKNTKVEHGKIHVWVFTNMGVVVKTENKIIAFDVADVPLSWSQKKMADIADIFMVSHSDDDHYDPALLNKALENGKSVILPEGLGFLYGDKNPRLYHPEYSKEIEIDNVKITLFQTDHRGNGSFMEPNAWYLVKVDGFTLLHTGDGRDLKNMAEKNNLKNYNIDIFLANAKVNVPFSVRDIGPKVFVPLHLFKYQHSREELEESTFKYFMDIYNEYTSAMREIEVKFLFFGEGFEYSR